MPPAPRKPQHSKTDPPPPANWPVLEVIALALFVARWFVPAEGMTRGETLWIAQGWMLWGAASAYLSFRRGERWTLQFGTWGIGVALLVAGHLLSALVVYLTEGQKRAALNGLWEWASIAVTAGWVAAHAPRAEFRRSLALATVSAAAVLSLLGLWQRHVWLPQLSATVAEFDTLERDLPTLVGAERRQAERRLQQLRSELGPEYVALDDQGRAAMRQRVQFSTEPLGRFALTNTLAALLAVGLFLGVPLLAAGPSAKRRLLLAIGTLLLIGYVLLLTKSRTAVIGVLCGAAVFAVVGLGARARRFIPWVLGAGAAFAVLAVIAWQTGGLDRMVVQEAPKSLRYRMEYWQGALEVLREHPWAGVGSGNFRQHYLQHKLPQSSEEILDPHNLFLDAWVSGGILAALGVLTLVLLGLWSLRAAPASPPEVSSRRESSPGFATSGAFLIAGVMIVLEQLAFVGVWDVQAFWLCGGAAVFATILGRFWPLAPQLERAAIGASFVALTVHLLGATGMEMPALVQLWLLLLCFQTRTQAARVFLGPWTSDRLPAVAAALLAVAAFTQLGTATLPVLTAKAMTSAGEATLISGNLRLAQQRFEEAAEADQLDPDPRRRLAQTAFSRWNDTGESGAFESAVAEQKAAIARDPRNPHDERILGIMYFRKFQKEQQPADARSAVEHLQTAAGLYPHHSVTQAALARALDATGDLDAARAAATRALAQNSLNRQLGHTDRLLPEVEVAALEAIAK